MLVAGKIVYRDGSFASADAEAAIRAAKGMRESQTARNRALHRFAEALEAAQDARGGLNGCVVGGAAALPSRPGEHPSLPLAALGGRRASGGRP